jgi:hypothetical protein
MRRSCWALALAVIAAVGRVGAQQSITIEAPHHSETAKLLRAAIAAPHDVLLADSSRRLVLPRGTGLPRTVIVLGGSASVGAAVRGDVIVVDGDLYLRPGASIDGRAIAIGGGVYGSTLARVTGGIRSIRDRTFHVSNTANTLVLRYENLEAHDSAVELPVLDGLRIPLYDRVDGLSVPWGPILRPTSRVEFEPTITYRSHIGEWDLGAHLLDRAGETWRLTLDARRSTFTNDAWIYSDLINSFNALTVGHDIRNYYRADRGEVALARTDRTTTAEFETGFGLLTERAWSVGSADTLGSRPWTFFSRGDAEKFLRANPLVERGRITSAFAGTTMHWRFGDVLTSAAARVEVPLETPSDARFLQLTIDASMRFPTFGVQRFRTDVHLVATPGDTAPPQRFAYLGGSGTLPVIENPLSLGGDQLLLIDSRYEIPLTRYTVPFAGAPTLALRHRIGSAGVQRLPRFVQNVGVMATLSFLRVEYSLDPATRNDRISLSLSFAR